MLIGDSLPNSIFIRLTILLLRLIAPASIVYCLYNLFLRTQSTFKDTSTFLLSTWAILESAFFLLIYIPLRSRLQAPVDHPEPPSRQQREVLFQRCLATVPSLSGFLEGWFLGAPLSSIKRENITEFFAWSYLNKTLHDVNEAEADELNGYVDQLESKFKHDFGAGYNPAATSLRGTMQSTEILHRPLVWYMIVGLVDILTSLHLLYHGFRFHRQSLRASLSTFPSRPLTFFASRSPSSKLSYWYRSHTSKTRLPILFIQGIGVGLYSYTDFLVDLTSKEDADDADDVGIIAIELLPISARLGAAALPGEEMKDEIREIVHTHGWSEVVLVGHSFGTAIAATIIRDHDFSSKVKAAVLMDPICFLLHLPDVAYNFTRRQPTTASEHMLYYFSSRDPMISHTLARRFFWSQYILRKEDIADLPATVSLSGRDIIVPTRDVWRYFAGSAVDESESVAAEERSFGSRDSCMEFASKSLKVIWFDRFNHADLFKSKEATLGAAQLVRGYCTKYGTEPHSRLANGSASR